MDSHAIKNIINQFTNPSGHIEKEKLRRYILESLTKLHTQVDYLINQPKNKHQLHQLHDKVTKQENVSTQKTQIQKAISQINHLHQDINHWIQDHVDTPERLEFSIQTKALEVNSGDQNYDYQLALTIRHDQLLAAVLVFQEAVSMLQELIQLPLPEAKESPQLNFFSTTSISDRIYHLAKQVYYQRTEPS